MRPATAFILSSIDVGMLSTVPEELAPCIDEVLTYSPLKEDVTGLLQARGVSVPELSYWSPETHHLRRLDSATREQIARSIQAMTVPEAKRLSMYTAIPGVVIPNEKSGLPPIPIPIPSEVVRVPDITAPGRNTIEFQELIPGIKLPKIPLLIPGIEKLPLFPGWVIRNSAGDIISDGGRLPVPIPGYISIPIPPHLPRPIGTEENGETLMHADDFLITEGDSDTCLTDEIDEEIEI